MENKQGKATSKVNKNKQPRKGPRTSGASPSKNAVKAANLKRLEGALKSNFGKK